MARARAAAAVAYGAGHGFTWAGGELSWTANLAVVGAVRGLPGAVGARWAEGRVYAEALRAPRAGGGVRAGQVVATRETLVCGLCGGRSPAGMTLEDWIDDHLLTAVDLASVPAMYRGRP